MSSLWRRLIQSRYAAAITPGLLFTLACIYAWLLFRVPILYAFIPCVITAHRIGILLHEFIHGIPFRRYRWNHNIVTLFDGLLLLWGAMEVFRGTHLAHHKWLNSPLDPARESEGRTRGKGFFATLAALETVQALVYLREALGGRKPYVRRKRVFAAMLLSLLITILLLKTGHVDVVWKMLAVTLFTTLVPISLRGAVEHYSYPGDPASTNEYRVRLPLFNLNRHVHHHEAPFVPWYLLEFRTERPLPNRCYYTHWFRVYITREFTLMKADPDQS